MGMFTRCWAGSACRASRSARPAAWRRSWPRSRSGPPGTPARTGWSATRSTPRWHPAGGSMAAGLAEVSALFAAAGITWVQDAWVTRDQVDAWLAAAAAGSLRFRANLAFRVEPTTWKDQLGELAADRDRVH